MASGHSFYGSGVGYGMGMGRQTLERLMRNPEVMSRLFQPSEVNRDYDIPYLGGISVDAKTVYLDRHLPNQLTLDVDGRRHTFDPAPFICAHERFEKAVMDGVGWEYPHAHEAANGYERRHVILAGLPWRDYQKSLEPFIKADEKEALEKVPGNLEMRPYLAPPVDNALIARMEKAMGGSKARKHSKADVRYGEGMATSHCGPVAKWPHGACEHFEAPNSCQLVRGYIKPSGWCGLWSPEGEGEHE